MATQQQFSQPPQYTTTTPQVTQPKETDGKVRPIPALRFFAIATIVHAFLFCILGTFAIAIKAEDSYVGDPIWTGVLFVLPTGIIGLASYSKKESLCLNLFYLILGIVVCLACGQLFFYLIINAVRDNFSRYYPSNLKCSPYPGYDYDYYNSDYHEECPFSWQGRVAVDSLIAVLAFVQIVYTSISLGFTCYGTCMCCYNCCRPAPPPAVIQYTAQNGVGQLVSVGGYQAPQQAYQPVQMMMVQQAPVAQSGHAVTPSMAVPTQQTQSVFVPASNTPVANVQQPVIGTPGNFVNPTAPPTVTAPGASGTKQGEKPTSSDTGAKQPQPDLTVSYGQTASDEFHDEKNLIEDV